MGKSISVLLQVSNVLASTAIASCPPTKTRSPDCVEVGKSPVVA